VVRAVSVHTSDPEPLPSSKNSFVWAEFAVYNNEHMTSELTDEEEKPTDTTDQVALTRRANTDLRSPGITALIGLVTSNPVMVLAAGAQAFYQYVKAGETDFLRAEFSSFAVESLADREALHSRLNLAEERLDNLTPLVKYLNDQSDLTGNEVTSVLFNVEGVYSRELDPEKRVLVAAALRSCLLNREKYRLGLRKRFLEALDGLTFSDVVALAAVVFHDAELASIAGFQLQPKGHVSVTNLASRASSHFMQLEGFSLVWKREIGDGPENAPRMSWGLTDLAEKFLAFVEATPELLRRLAEGSTAKREGM
jgi:hypothetical protein